ncbi:hypothetical protein L1887_07528 [Cichorium endivia]|nr:hypothetical protein L1887_07528 [Cichorium endivia]
MGRLLMLDFQLDCIDYEPENWYHADLDFETFKILQNVPGGKLNRGLSVVDSYKLLKGEELTEDELFLS